MLLLLVKGTKEILLGYESYLLKCPSCETHQFAEVFILSKYYHVWWMPFVPVGKEVNITCNKCGLKRRNIPLEKSNFHELQEMRKKYKHPWYTYIGIGIGIFSLVIAIMYILL